MGKSLTLHRTTSQNLTLQNALAAFLQAANARNLSPKTIRYYEFENTRFVHHCQASQVYDLSEITPATIRSFLISLRDRGLKGTSQHGAARAIKAWLNWCVDQGLLATSPMRLVQMPKQERDQLPALSEYDVDVLLNACETTRDKAIILCLLDSGCRAAELVALNVGDVNRRTGEVVVRLGKGRKSRMTFFGPKARAEVMKYLYGRKVDMDAPLFVSDRGGGRLTVSGLGQLCKRLGKLTGIHVSPHALRRTCATFCYRSGWTLEAIRRLLGHSDFTVLRRYLDLDSDDIRQAHESAPPSGRLR